MIFFDYNFTVEPNGSIFFDNELTSEQLNIMPGDGFMAFVNADGTVILRKIDLSKIENIQVA